MKLTRVTLDWDFGKLKAIYFLLKIILFENKKISWYSIELRKSPSHKQKGKGYHCIIWYYGKVPKFKLRKKFKDDPNRIRIDRMHRKNKQFLFRVKRKIKL